MHFLGSKNLEYMARVSEWEENMVKSNRSYSVGTLIEKVCVWGGLHL